METGGVEVEARVAAPWTRPPLIVVVARENELDPD